MVAAALDPLVEFRDRPQGLGTDPLNLTLDKDMGRFVQVPEEGLGHKFGFKAKSRTGIEQKSANRRLALVEQLQADRDIGGERGQAAHGGRTMTAWDHVPAGFFQQIENFLEEVGQEIGGPLEIFETGGVQALGKSIPPVAKDGDLVEADTFCQIDLHARNIREAHPPGFAPLVYS